MGDALQRGADGLLGISCDKSSLRGTEARMPTVSIIMPVYNSEAHLDDALRSACSQSFADIEIICVDDGSTDGSAYILHQWAVRDCRISIVTQQNAGVSAARNVGLDRSRGRIIMFLDADDRFLPCACSRVVDVFEAEDPDVLTFGAQCFPERAASAHLQEALSPRNAVYSHFSEDILFKENARPYMWRSAFSNEFLKRNGLCFLEGLGIAEDQVFYFEAYPCAKKTVLISDKLYQYRVGDASSAMGKAQSNDGARVACHVRAAERIANVWAENGWFLQFGWETLAWLVEFVSLDLFKLPSAQRLPLQKRLGEMLLRILANAGDARCGNREASNIAQNDSEASNDSESSHLRQMDGMADDTQISDGNEPVPSSGLAKKAELALAKSSLSDLPLGGMAKRLMARILDMAAIDDAPAPSQALLTAFYVERRGIGACIKRVLKG